MDAKAAGVMEGKMLMQFGSRYPARASSVKFGNLPASKAGTKTLEVQPSMTQRSTFFKIWS
jgi:hypothetical protein